MRIAAIRMKPNQSSCADLHGFGSFRCSCSTTYLSSAWMSSSFTLTICLQLVDVHLLHVLDARRPLAVLRQITQRAISATPCTIMSAPARGMKVLKV